MVWCAMEHVLLAAGLFCSSAALFSAQMLGIDALLHAIDVRLQQLTGRAQYELNIPLDDADQISFIYREGTVTETG